MRALLKGSRVVLQKPKMSADKNILLLLLFFLISIKTTKKKEQFTENDISSNSFNFNKKLHIL